MSSSRIAEPAAALAAGLLFGLGLVVSRMVDPAKVLAFLDLAGRWDPSLALVMAAAVAVASIGFAFAGKRARTVLGLPMRLPQTAQVDRRLVAGGLVFGAGWGLAGLCPGPALLSLWSGQATAVAFVVSMLAGMALHELHSRRGP